MKPKKLRKEIRRLKQRMNRLLIALVQEQNKHGDDHRMINVIKKRFPDVYDEVSIPF